MPLQGGHQSVVNQNCEIRNSVPHPERWQSGRLCSTGNAVCGQPYRGFESPSLRLVEAADTNVSGFFRVGGSLFHPGTNKSFSFLADASYIGYCRPRRTVRWSDQYVQFRGEQKPMQTQIDIVTDDQQLPVLADLAREIWQQHFVPIIGQHQVDYMLNKFQSAGAMKTQIASGYEYYLAIHKDEPAGYCAVRPNEPLEKLMLSKLYVRDATRGTGVGSDLLKVAHKRVMETGGNAVWLTVNRHNTLAIEWYKRRRFAVTDEQKSDIGGGFYMDDYIMEWRLGPQTVTN